MAIRVLIVDDSAMMRSFLREVLSESADIEVVGTAPDANTARQKIKLLKPDVLTLDIEMPSMDGITFLDHLMRLQPMPVVMVSTQTHHGAATTLRALELGAADFVAKPNQGLDLAWPEFGAELTFKVIAAAKSKVKAHHPILADSDHPGGQEYSKIVAIGGSTGSVGVIQHIICSMPADGPSILVVVHMPPLFTKQLALRLDGLSRISVTEAVDGAPLTRGHAYIAPGDRHLNIGKSGSGYVCKLEAGPRVNGFIPSVDVLFESVAMHIGAGSVGILLSGMGKDGALGLKAMMEAGAKTATQDRASSVVYGMPAAAVAMGASGRELDVATLPKFIIAEALGSSNPKKRWRGN